MHYLNDVKRNVAQKQGAVARIQGPEASLLRYLHDRFYRIRVTPNLNKLLRYLERIADTGCHDLSKRGSQHFAKRKVPRVLICLFLQ